MVVHTLDLHFQDTPGLIAAYLIECGGELALIETGPGSTLPTLRRAIAALGFDEKAVRHVFITHIHLDHAGAAGWWAQQGAQVYCHANAERHLIHPEKLMASARLVYGSAMERLWGDMLPAPSERVTVLADGESVRVGQVDIVAWDTPGHARHHHAYIVEGQCFTGDVAGMRLDQSAYLSVTAAPPQFDPVAYVASVDRLIAAGFQRLYLTHFGEIQDVLDHLGRYRQRIIEVHESVRGWVTAGCDLEEIKARYAEQESRFARQAGLSESAWQTHEQTNSTAMCAEGVRLYVEKNP